MKILLSAYACEPGKGSEQGVGWHWATQLAHLDHDVFVITRANNRVCIENALADARLDGLQFRYYDLPRWAMRWKRGPRGVHLYYVLWQAGAYLLAKRLVAETKFDVVHHLTFGVFCQPSFMGRLGIPFIVGPIGGGEAVPASLRKSLPFRGRAQERFRDLSNRLASFDPFVSAMLTQAALIFCKTQETFDLLPATCKNRSRIHLEIGLEPERIRRQAEGAAIEPAFLYAGRLIYWKGVQLALRALAELKRTNRAATLAIIGKGPHEAWLKRLARSLGVERSVQWMGWVPHGDLWDHYSRYSAFVFPSLHDSSGNVLLEAMSQGLPVICIDTGGPGAVVPPSAGIKVQAAGRSQAQVVTDIAAAMQTLTDSPELRARMSQGALEFARASTWNDVVTSAYAGVEDALNPRRMDILAGAS